MTNEELAMKNYDLYFVHSFKIYYCYITVLSNGTIVP